MDKPMNAFRYDTSGSWHKGNTHMHSTASDGGKTFPELAEMYSSVGYDFLFRTDHWVLSDAGKDTDDYPLLWIDGVELDGKDSTEAYFHVVCLGQVTGICREDGLEAGLEAARQQGALTVLAHPHWCGNSLDDAVRGRFDGVEVYNHVCHWLNGKSGGLVHWDAALNANPNTLGFAVDDAHLRAEHPGWNGGWVMVNAPECTAEAIIAAIRRGNYYSSCGPEMHSIAFDGTEVHVETSPIRFARLVGPRSTGQRAGSFDGELLTEVSFVVPEGWGYAYLEIEDEAGRRAWTNSLLTANQ
jgi:hypothetical protein